MMLHQPVLLPVNWLELVQNYDILKIKNQTSKCIAQQVQKFILDKRETIIGARFIQVFLDAVIKITIMFLMILLIFQIL